MKKPERPNIRDRKDTKGKTRYFIDYWDPFAEKRIRVMVGTRERDARGRAEQIYDELMARYLGEPSSANLDVSIEELIQNFLRSKEGRVSPASMIRYRIYARNFLSFFSSITIGANSVRKISSAMLNEHLERLREGERHQPKTLNGHLQFLKSVFNYAVAEGYVSNNPLVRIKPFRETKRSEGVAFWTVEEVVRILGAVKPAYRDAFEFLYNTGLRKAELQNLTWADVNLDPSKPSIIIQSKEDWTTKTNARRVVPLSPRAVELIQRQPQTSPKGFVFKSPNGAQLHRDHFYRELKRALEELGLVGDVHQWRHTFASHLVMAGVGIETVSKLLGHTTTETTAVYAHLAPDHLQNAVKQLPVIDLNEDESKR